ncbi:NUDIX domain-containing protein [Acidianus sulfidivorans JP7]|uniref:Coenzyme A pyrophosphatase n=1 Tax=Acidianus sulfidivorans JP7 TaxID=619593 RepID=A0A2U9IKQ4_9CREN|nr:CoA pyrophosphatase [Acidianus sulfidivorans]AWR96601.1 NUDIX domain-containing protein [Acidianus sulfidivorans JP7]
MICDAAVVLLINNENKFLLIKRAENPNDPWSGNMALPGGHREGNESCVDTAIRECIEEVGIKPEIRKFLGIYSPHNRFLRVAAFLGYTEKTEIKVSKSEVEKYFWVDFRELRKGENCFYYKDNVIWGMTYRILRDFSPATDTSSFRSVDQSSF